MELAGFLDGLPLVTFTTLPLVRPFRLRGFTSPRCETTWDGSASSCWVESPGWAALAAISALPRCDSSSDSMSWKVETTSRACAADPGIQSEKTLINSASIKSMEKRRERGGSSCDTVHVAKMAAMETAVYK